MGKSNVSTKDVLKFIGVSSLVISSLAFPGLPGALIKSYKLFRNTNKSDLGRIIKRLERQHLINISEEEDKFKLEITEKGKRRILKYDFEKIELKNIRRDGKWRLVIFDIPEYKKSARELFRRKLIQLGMVRLQDSIFVSAMPCKDEVDFLCHFLGVSDFVTIIQFNKIERGEKVIFKKYFNWDN